MNDRRLQQGGIVTNPVRFSSSELLAILGIGQAGKNYSEMYEWLERMAATAIRSTGVVFLAQKKVFARDLFHVFDRVATTGSELSDGSLADANYVWLSDWQLDNINQNYLLPVDFETYRGLKNNIAKALVPLLQLWLYASRAHGVFEKRYDDLCELLSLRPQKYPSDIQRQLGPSLDELASKGFLACWSLDCTQDGRAYKITASHGPKFFADQRAQWVPSTQLAAENIASWLVEALVQRGVMEGQATKLLQSLPSDQPVLDQIEYIDAIIGKGRIDNPPGLYVALLKSNVPVPDTFATRTRRRGNDRREQESFERQLVAWEQSAQYDAYVRAAVDRQIAESLGEEEFAARVDTTVPTCRQQYPLVPASTLVEIAQSLVRNAIRSSLPLLSREQFARAERQPRLFADEV